MVGRVVALADNSVQVRLAPSLIRADALFENALRLFDELAVQVDAVGVDTAGGVVLPEDVVGSLVVVFLHLGIVGLALVGQFLRSGAVAILVRALRLNAPPERTCQYIQSILFRNLCLMCAVKAGEEGPHGRRFNVHVRSNRHASVLQRGPYREGGRTRALLRGSPHDGRLLFWSVNWRTRQGNQQLTATAQLRHRNRHFCNLFRDADSLEFRIPSMQRFGTRATQRRRKAPWSRAKLGGWKLGAWRFWAAS